MRSVARFSSSLTFRSRFPAASRSSSAPREDRDLRVAEAQIRLKNVCHDVISGAHHPLPEGLLPLVADLEPRPEEATAQAADKRDEDRLELDRRRDPRRVSTVSTTMVSGEADALADRYRCGRGQLRARKKAA